MSKSGHVSTQQSWRREQREICGLEAPRRGYKHRKKTMHKQHGQLQHAVDQRVHSLRQQTGRRVGRRERRKIEQALAHWYT